MSRATEHPSRDELLVMAYVDDELVPEQRELFEQRLADEPQLLRQVAVYQKLAVLARQALPPEPTDIEWQRITAAPLHKAGIGLGWSLLIAGLGGVLVLGFIAICQADLSTPVKIVTLAPWFGFGLLLIIRLRDRAHLYPLDPYTDVKR